MSKDVKTQKTKKDQDKEENAKFYDELRKEDIKAEKGIAKKDKKGYRKFEKSMNGGEKVEKGTDITKLLKGGAKKLPVIMAAREGYGLATSSRKREEALSAAKKIGENLKNAPVTGVTAASTAVKSPFKSKSKDTGQGRG